MLQSMIQTLKKDMYMKLFALVSFHFKADGEFSLLFDFRVIDKSGLTLSVGLESNCMYQICFHYILQQGVIKLLEDFTLLCQNVFKIMNSEILHTLGTDMGHSAKNDNFVSGGTAFAFIFGVN